MKHPSIFAATLCVCASLAFTKAYPMKRHRRHVPPPLETFRAELGLSGDDIARIRAAEDRGMEIVKTLVLRELDDEQREKLRRLRETE